MQEARAARDGAAAAAQFRPIDDAPRPVMPSGIGFYARTLATATHGTPAQMAKRLRDHGVSFVAFMACWQERRAGRFITLPEQNARIAIYAEACANAGIDVWLWGFPWVGHEDAYMRAMRDAATACPVLVRGFIHDPEVSYKDRKAKRAPAASRGQGEAIDALPEVDASATALGIRRLVEFDREARRDLKLVGETGITSYGMAAWHALPWEAFDGYGWGSPQLYTVGPAQVDQGIASWRARGWETLLPSVPTFGPESGGKLGAHLEKFVDGDERVDGFVFWSYQQTGAVEWRTIAKWAERLAASNRRTHQATRGGGPGS